MKNLLLKEFKLSMHPTALIFLSLSAMLIIPNYPYYVTFFYTGLAVFFTCLSGRENKDILYTILLPVSKKDIVKARFLFVIIIQLAQLLLAVPFALLRQSFDMPGNQVGMDANIAFFGLSFLMLGIFNLVYFHVYYNDVNKVGKAFAISSIVITLYIIIIEACTHAVPFMRNYLDTRDPEYLVYKLIVLAIGILVYIFMTAVSCKKSIKSFESIDL